MAEAAVNIKELEKNQEWWRVAELKRSKRLDYLRKAMWKKGAIGGLYAPGIKSGPGTSDTFYRRLFCQSE